MIRPAPIRLATCRNTTSFEPRATPRLLSARAASLLSFSISTSQGKISRSLLARSTPVQEGIAAE